MRKNKAFFTGNIFNTYNALKYTNDAMYFLKCIFYDKSKHVI